MRQPYILEDICNQSTKPGIDDCQGRLGLHYVASRVLGFLQPDFERTSLSAIAGDIHCSMLEGVDFEEARNTEDFRRFFGRKQTHQFGNGSQRSIASLHEYLPWSDCEASACWMKCLFPRLPIAEMGQAAIITALNIWFIPVMKMRVPRGRARRQSFLLLDGRVVNTIDFGIVGRVIKPSRLSMN
jgi:aarF domain-containing kinase